MSLLPQLMNPPPTRPSVVPGDVSHHSRAPSSPALSLHQLHIAVQLQDEEAPPPSNEPLSPAAAAAAALTLSRSMHPSLSSYSSIEAHDGPSQSGLLLQPVFVPSPLPSSPPSPSGTGSSTPTFFASIEQQKREIEQEQAGRQQRHRHSVLASLPPPPAPPAAPPHHAANGHTHTVQQAHLQPPPLRRRELSHHQTTLSSQYCSSLLASRAADPPYPLLFCVLTRRIAEEGDNFLLYSYPSSSSVSLQLLSLIHTFAIVNDAADAVTAQSVRRLLLEADTNRQQRDVVVSVHEEDERLYVLALTGVGQRERQQWEVRVESLLLTLCEVLCTLYGAPHAQWFEPPLSTRPAREEAGIDPSRPVAVPSVPASGGSFISALLILASSYYSLRLLDPLLRLFCHRLYCYPSPELSFTPLCGLIAARTMEAEEEAVWRAARIRLQAGMDETGINAHLPPSPSTAFVVDSLLLYHHCALVRPEQSSSLSHSLTPRLLSAVTAILTLTGWLDDKPTVSATATSSFPSSSPSSALRSRVFRVYPACSLEQNELTEGTGHAVLSVAGQAGWLTVALLLPRPSQPALTVAHSSMDPYYLEPLQSLLTALLRLRSGPPPSVPHSFALHYSFSVSSSSTLVLHPNRRSLCPSLHTACCRLHSSLLSSVRRFPAAASTAADAPVSGGDTNDKDDAALLPSLSPPMLSELAVTALDHSGVRYWVRGRCRQSGAGAVLLYEPVAAVDKADEEPTRTDDGGRRATESRASGTTSAADERIVAASLRVDGLFARGWELLSELLYAGETDQ